MPSAPTSRSPCAALPSSKAATTWSGLLSKRLKRFPRCSMPAGSAAASRPIRAARWIEIVVWPYCVFTGPRSNRESTVPDCVRIWIPSSGQPASATAAARPSLASVCIALGGAQMPLPTGRSSGAASYTATSHPFWRKATAAVRPPMPPPMISALGGVFIIISSIRHHPPFGLFVSRNHTLTCSGCIVSCTTCTNSASSASRSVSSRAVWANWASTCWLSYFLRKKRRSMTS